MRSPSLTVRPGRGAEGSGPEADSREPPVVPLGDGSEFPRRPVASKSCTRIARVGRGSDGEGLFLRGCIGDRSDAVFPRSKGA
jgi:hypothetical protein